MPNSPFNVKIFKNNDDFAKFLVTSQTESSNVKYDSTSQSNGQTTTADSN